MPASLLSMGKQRISEIVLTVEQLRSIDASFECRQVSIVRTSKEVYRRRRHSFLREPISLSPRSDPVSKCDLRSSRPKQIFLQRSLYPRRVTGPKPISILAHSKTQRVFQGQTSATTTLGWKRPSNQPHFAKRRTLAL